LDIALPPRQKKQPMHQLYVNDAFFQTLREIDKTIFLEAKARGCLICGGPLDTSNIPRKPRGLGELEDLRFSLCCRREGCRKRLTPPSLRFFGRKVYPALVVILAVDFCRELGLSQRIARQTLARWRSLWRERLAEPSPFMRRARGFLPPGCKAGTTPGSLTSHFGFPSEYSWIPMLRFFTQLEAKNSQPA
jgi:hypothetical protein